MKKNCKYCGQPFPYHTGQCPVVSVRPATRREWLNYCLTFWGLLRETARVRWQMERRGGEYTSAERLRQINHMVQFEKMQDLLR